MIRRSRCSRAGVALGVAIVVAVGAAGCSGGSAPATSTSAATRTASASATTATATPTATPTPTASPSASLTQAQLTVEHMSLSARVGTLVMTAGTVSQFPSLASVVRQYGLGGAMVRGRSSAGVTAVARAVATVRAAAAAELPPLIATDQEGGEVQVLSGSGFATIPSAQQQATLSPSALQARAAGWGSSLRKAGVSLNLAPVADLVCAADRTNNPPIADLDRNYGWTLASVSRSVRAVVAGMHAAHVETAVKHFPGLGCVTENTDVSANVVDHTTTADSAAISAFQAGIAAGTGFVMVSSAEYAKIDAGTPALFSKTIVTGLLRNRLGFDGVIMTDDVGGAKAVAAWDVGVRATRFIAAGGDLILDILPGDVPTVVGALRAKAIADPAFAQQVKLAAERVVQARLASR